MQIFYRVGEAALQLNSGSLRVVRVSGISPSAQLSIEENSSDGGTFLSSRLRTRNIVLLLAADGDFKAAAENIRGFFRLGTEGVLCFSEDGRVREIACRAEKVSFSLDERLNVIQISLLCPQPFFSSDGVTRVIIHGTSPCFGFPLRLYENDGFCFAENDCGRIGVFINDGEAVCGCVFTIEARFDCVNPMLQNADSFEWIKVEADLKSGDKIIIDTRSGQKSVTLDRGGVRSDIINSIFWGSTFLQLPVGQSRIAVSAESGQDNLTVTGEFVPLYGGI